MKPDLDAQKITETFYHAIQGQLEVNSKTKELLSQAERLAASHSTDSPGVLGTLRALKSASTKGATMLATLEVAKRNALQASPSFGPPTICPGSADAKRAA